MNNSENIITSNQYRNIILKNNYKPYEYILFQPNIIDNGQPIISKSSNIIKKQKFNKLSDNMKR
jgi:hypothetical protein